MAAVFKKKYLIITLIILFLILIGYFILPVSVPIIMALATALILDPLIKFFQQRLRFKRKLAVLIIFLLFSLFIGFAAFFITTKVASEAVKLVESTPTYINEINQIWIKYKGHLQNLTNDLPEELVLGFASEVENFLDGLIQSLRLYLNIENITALLSFIPNYLVSFIVYLIALFLFMLELPTIIKGIYSHLTDKTADAVKFMTSRLSYVFLGFFKAQFLVSIIIFAVALIGLFIITPEVALVMSIIIWIIDIIPIIGSIVILAPWSIYHLLAGNIALGTQLAILAVVLLIIRRTVEPKVMGSQIGLSPLATLISMYIGLKLIGILGFIVGPLLLIILKSAREAGIIKLNFKI